MPIQYQPEFNPESETTQYFEGGRLRIKNHLMDRSNEGLPNK
jgi:hypothetical protein